MLLAIADRANDHGDGRQTAWPSVGEIAGRVNLTPRRVRAIIADLVDRGELIIEAKPGHRNTYEIPLTPDETITPDETVTPDEADRGGVKPTVHTPDGSISQTIKNHKEPKKGININNNGNHKLERNIRRAAQINGIPVLEGCRCEMTGDGLMISMPIYKYQNFEARPQIQNAVCRLLTEMGFEDWKIEPDE